MTNQQMWDEILVAEGWVFTDGVWCSPDNKKFYQRLPPTLPNLFKFVIPRVYWWDLFGFKGNSPRALIQLTASSEIVDTVSTDPAQALLEDLHKALVE